jgi:hypothetical protein
MFEELINEPLDEPSYGGVDSRPQTISRIKMRALCDSKSDRYAPDNCIA